MNHIWRAVEILGGLTLVSVGGNLWQYYLRSQALVQPTFLPKPKPALKTPEGICKDCHGIFQPVGIVAPFYERCSGCGEIRELVGDEWVYHFAVADSDTAVKDSYKMD